MIDNVGTGLKINNQITRNLKRGEKILLLSVIKK